MNRLRLIGRTRSRRQARARSGACLRPRGIANLLRHGAFLIAALAAASPTSVVAGTWQEEQTLEHDGVTRLYRTYVPDFQPEGGYPVLFILHGGGGGMRNVLNSGTHAEWPEIADEEGLLLIVPNGINDETGDASGNDQHWNDCRGDAVLAETGADDVGFIGALIAWADSGFDIDLDRVYATGSSNGGMMSYRLAFELGHGIAAIASFIANLPAVSECFGPAYPIPVFIANGDAEMNYMPWEGGCVVANGGCQRGTVRSALETRDYWIDFNNIDPVPVETVNHPDIEPNDGCTATSELFTAGAQGSEVKFYRIAGGGHTTPTIDHPRSALVRQLLGLGNQNQDIEGSREAWGFLKEHTLKGTGGTIDPGATGTLLVDRDSDGSLHLSWGPDCGAAASHGVYRGDLNAGYSSILPEPGLCDLPATSASVPEGSSGADFFLVVPNDSVMEGSYGRGVGGAQRAPSGVACYPQSASLDDCSEVGF